MIEHPVQQGSEAWHILRLGKPTASDFDRLVTPEWKVRTGQTPQTYLYEKLAELITGKVDDSVKSFAMEQGHLLEREAIPYYELMHDVKVRRVGFCTTDDMRIGCSPDGLIGEDGGIECKCPFPETHLRYLLDGGLPKEYAAQVHGSMFVTGRKYWVFMSYSRHFPAHLVRVERDEEIQKVIGEALAGFTGKMAAAVERIEALRKPKP